MQRLKPHLRVAAKNHTVDQLFEWHAIDHLARPVPTAEAIQGFQGIGLCRAITFSCRCGTNFYPPGMESAPLLVSLAVL
jgi:hypothetical protein